MSRETEIFGPEGLHLHETSQSDGSRYLWSYTDGIVSSSIEAPVLVLREASGAHKRSLKRTRDVSDDGLI